MELIEKIAERCEELTAGILCDNPAEPSGAQIPINIFEYAPVRPRDDDNSQYDVTREARYQGTPMIVIRLAGETGQAVTVQIYCSIFSNDDYRAGMQKLSEIAAELKKILSIQGHYAGYKPRQDFVIQYGDDDACQPVPVFEFFLNIAFFGGDLIYKNNI